MEIKKLTLGDNDYPSLLTHITGPPKQLYYLSEKGSELLNNTAVAVVGSRKFSPYGHRVTLELTGELARAGLVIVSGLALGVDSFAHQAALESQGQTIAVLPCGLDTVYPVSHRNLARRILETGGMLISEHPPGTVAFKQNFIARNRIISGLSQGVLITEAAEKSGSLHTARFALEQGREVFAVPGNITSPHSVGTNNLIKAGASPVSRAQDILFALHIDRSLDKASLASNPEEQLILNQLTQGIHDSDMLLQVTGLSADVFHRTITMLELSGKIKTMGGGQWYQG